MSDNKINFTKASIENIPLPPQGKRVYYYDTKTRSLTICVTSTGSKTFYVVRRVEGKPERVRIGPYPDLSIEQARKMAEEVNGVIAKGENPNLKKREARAELTFGKLFEKFIEVHARPHKKSWKEDQAQYNRYLTCWADKKVSTIRKDDIRTLHAKVGDDNGIYAANRLLALLRTVFNFAINSELFEKDNPTRGIKLFKETSRERRLHAHELPAFFQALNEEPNETIRDYVYMSLWSGARRSNVLEMKWEQICFEREVWTIPETKNGTSQTVPLTKTAIELLKQRQEKADGPYVFPGPGQTGHLAEPKKGWARILERAGLTDLRLHDLRRTMGSWQVDTGASLVIVGRSLGHKSPQTTAIYARLDVDPVRQAMANATDAMLKAGRIEPETTD